MPEVEFGKTLPYAFAAQLYLDAGWSPLPLFPGPKRKKGIPPSGFTGSAGRMATQADVTAWAATDAGRPIGVRLPPDVIGIDVDAYAPKNGAERLRLLEAELGELPPTWKSTARLDGVSGIRFYRVPSGRRFAADLGGDIELICHGYRFARVWPSPHPDGGTYQWHDPMDVIQDGVVPSTAELPQLPFTWLQRCMDGPEGADEADTGVWASSGRYSKPDIEQLRVAGIPADAYHDNVLKDVAWELRVLGFSPDEAFGVWKEIVGKTPPKDLSHPFSDDDFWKRHWKGAARKIPDSAVMTDAQRDWAGSLAVAGRANADEAASGTQSDSEPASGEEDVASEAAQLQAIVNALVKRDADGQIALGATHEHLPRSDMSSADMILRMTSDGFTYSTQSLLWRIWDGTVHTRAEDGQAETAVRYFARAYKEAMRLIRTRAVSVALFEGSTPQEAEEQYERTWKKHRAYRDAIWMQPGQVKIVKQMAAHVSLSEERFDNPDDYSSLTVAENGVIAVADGSVTLLAHSSARKVTVRCGRGIRWDERAPMSAWERFLETSVTDDGQRMWLQQSMGLALIGRPGKSFVNLIGKTNSGKSTFIRAVSRVLGGYGRSVSVETFLEGVGSSEFRLHELKGARVAFATEPAANRRLNTEVIKAVTGGDEQRTREPYGKFVTWKPQCLIIIASNQPQKFETSDTAMLNRIGPVAFRVPEEPDWELDEKLKDESEGILRWLIEGAVSGLRGRVAMPESMVALREAMAERVDDVLSWLNESIADQVLAYDPSAPDTSCIRSGDAYQMYMIWCAMNGVKPIGSKTFSQRVNRLYPVVRTRGSRFSGLVATQPLPPH